MKKLVMGELENKLSRELRYYRIKMKRKVRGMRNIILFKKNNIMDFDTNITRICNEYLRKNNKSDVLKLQKNYLNKFLEL